MIPTNEDQPGFMGKVTGEMAKAMERSWDHCTMCKKALPPGTPSNKLYDVEIGHITVCVDCTLKAVVLQVRSMYGKKP